MLVRIGNAKAYGDLVKELDVRTGQPRSLKMFTSKKDQLLLTAFQFAFGQNGAVRASIGIRDGFGYLAMRIARYAVEHNFYARRRFALCCIKNMGCQIACHCITLCSAANWRQGIETEP